MALEASQQRWRPPSKRIVPEEERRKAIVLRLGLMSPRESWQRVCEISYGDFCWKEARQGGPCLQLGRHYMSRIFGGLGTAGA